MARFVAYPEFWHSHRLLLAFAALGIAAHAQPSNPGGGPTIGGPIDGGGNNSGPIVRPGGGDDGGTTITIPGDGSSGPIVGGPDGGGPSVTEPTLIAPRGTLLGSTVTATVMLPSQTAGSGPPTYQWSVTGAQASNSTKSSFFEFTADRVGTATVYVNGSYNGTSYSLSANVTVISAATAGKMSAPTTLAANTAAATASVPPAQNADRTFRWSISGDAAITDGQNTAQVTFRPGSPGVKELVCSVNLQNLVTVSLRSAVVVTGEGPPVTVTVNRGAGGGTYSGGTRVDVFAHAPAAGEVFDRWTGDIDALEAADAAALTSPHAVVRVPGRTVNLSATYKTTPVWSPIHVAAFAGTGVGLSYFVPATPRGLVLLLHDRGADAASWFNRPEGALFTRDLVAAGYGVAALSCSDRSEEGTWSIAAGLESNADLRNHAAVLDKLGRENPALTGKPIFFVGCGAGGNASALYAQHFVTTSPASPAKGVAFLNSGGNEVIAVTSRIPHFFASAAGDDPLASFNLSQARTHADLLAGRGVLAERISFARAPVYADRFRVLGVTTPAFSATEAQAIWTAMRTADLLDSNSHVRGTPEIDEVTAALPEALRRHAAAVAAQLTLGRGGPELNSEVGSRLRAFFDACVAGTANPTPGRLVNLSFRTRIAFVGDTFTLGFALSGSERTTLLVRGIGPGLGRFGVATALPAPRLEVHRGSTLLATNENWQQGNGSPGIPDATRSVGAFPLRPADLDAALLITLEPGSHTVTLRGVNGTNGDALVEVYDVSRNATRIVNLSALTKISTEGEMLFPGIVIAGSNPRTLLARAIGPGLSELGNDASFVLGDPRIAVLNGTGNIVRSNQNWSVGNSAALAAVFPAVGAFPLKNDSADAALITALTAGAYTLQVGAAATSPGTAPQNMPNATGSVLVELYEVP